MVVSVADKVIQQGLNYLRQSFITYLSFYIIFMMGIKTGISVRYSHYIFVKWYKPQIS